MIKLIVAIKTEYLNVKVLKSNVHKVILGKDSLLWFMENTYIYILKIFLLCIIQI